MDIKILISFIINIIIIFLGYTSLTIELNNSLERNTYYINFWGFFRFFTNDGNIYSIFVSCVIFSFQFSILFFKLNSNILKNNILYLLCLGSAVSEIIILLVVLILLLPQFGLFIITSYTMFNLHIFIPILVTIRFILFENKKNNIDKTKTLYGSLPIMIYGLITLFFVLFKVYTKENNKIPYPFFELYDNPLWFSILSIGGIVISTFGLCILMNYLNEILKNKLFEKENINSTSF